MLRLAKLPNKEWLVFELAEVGKRVNLAKILLKKFIALLWVKEFFNPPETEFICGLHLPLELNYITSLSFHFGVKINI